MNRVAIIAGIIIAGCFRYSSGNGQTVFSLVKGLQKQADENFDAELYIQAIPLYTDLLRKHPEIVNNRIPLAQCFYNTRQYEKAIRQYDRFLKETGKSLSYEDLYRYAEAQTVLQLYPVAIESYTQLLQSDPDNDLILKKIWRLKNIQYLLEDSTLSSVRPLNFTSTGSEICPVQYKNKLVFAATAKPSGIIKNINLKTNASFYQLYMVEKVSESHQPQEATLFDHPKPFAKELKVRYNIGPVAFYKENTEMVFVSSSEEVGISGERTLGLYFAKLENSQWVRTAAFPFNSNAYSINDVTINDSGTQLYFSSDMDGGIGNSDIYVSNLINGKWTKPQNLGEPINTPGNELFPYLQGSETLYFSSDGHPGIGGMDIFKTVITSSLHEEPQNLGYPLNSSMDDFGINIDSTGAHGYLTSNRLNGGNDDDLFEFDWDLQTYPFTISGVLRVKDHAWSDPSTIQVWSDQQVALIDSQRNKVIVETTTDSSGNFSITIPYLSRYFIQIIDKSGTMHKVSLDIQKHKTDATEHEIVIVKDMYSQ